MTAAEPPRDPTPIPAPVEPPPSADNRRLRRGWSAVWPLLVVFGVALLVRLAYLHEIRAIPFVPHPQGGARSYDQWARRIAGGDWWGSEVFYQAPAYPYLLACVYSVVGHSLWAAHVVQMALGALSCALIYLAGRRLFKPAVGVAAGAILALYPPAIFFDGLIQKAGLGLVLMSLLLYLIARGQQRPTWWLWGLGGAVTGLLSLTRENALLFVPLVAVWLALRFQERTRTLRARWAAGYLAGVGIVLLPVALRNYSLGGTFAPTTSQMGPNFYIGNHASATGLYVPLVPGRQDARFEQRDAVELAERNLGRELTPAEVSDYWLDRGLRFVRDQPGAWLKLCGRKWDLVWNHFEVPDVEGVYAYADWSPMLRDLTNILHFGVLVPLAVVGLALTWARRRDLWILYALVLLTAISVTMFYVFARYRFPLVPMLVLFAGAACVEGYVTLRAKNFRGVVVPAVLGLIVAVVVNRSILPEEQYRAISYMNLGSLCVQEGLDGDAERFLSRAIEMWPDEHNAHFALGKLRAEQNRLAEAEDHLRKAAALDPATAKIHAILANVLVRTGRVEQATAHYQEAIRLRPTFAQARSELAELWLLTGSPENAVAELQRLVALEPHDARTLARLGFALRSLGRVAEADRRFIEAMRIDQSIIGMLRVQGITPPQVSANTTPAAAEPGKASRPGELVTRARQAAELGRFGEAIGLYRQALALEPGNAPAHYLLGRALHSADRIEEAVSHYQRAVELVPQFVEAHNDLGIAYRQLNDLESAARHYRLACKAKPDMLSAHYNLGVVLANLGRYSEAVEAMERCQELVSTSPRADLEERIADRLTRYRARAAQAGAERSD